jgi:hypothetical protein
MERVDGFNLKNFAITSLFGFAACLLIGFLFYQTRIFNLADNRFVFASLGFTGALVFASLLYGNVKDSIIILTAALLLNIFICKNHQVSFIIRDIAVFSSFGLSIFLYKNWFYNSSAKYKYLRAFGLGVITAILFLIAGIFLIFINVPLERISIELIFQISFYYLHMGLLIGLGLGLGFDLADYFIGKSNPVEPEI